MHKTLFLMVLLLSLSTCFASGQVKKQTYKPSINDTKSNKMKIKINDKEFIVTLNDNPTAKAFKTLLPLSLLMNELNDNEKYAQLPKNIPINATTPTSIQSGDLMMYGASTLVLFYKEFNTTYRYTKIGKIEDISGLEEALGKDNVKVNFELL